MSMRQSENQELAMLNHLESLLLEKREQGVITREEHISVSTMISMAEFDFSDMGKLATSRRKLEIPSFESQYQGILKAMKLDRLLPFLVSQSLCRLPKYSQALLLLKRYQ